MSMMHDDLFFYEGERPKPTTVRLLDLDGALDTSIVGSTITAKTKIDGETEVSLGCVDGADGTFTITWPRSPSASVFIMPTGKDRSIMRIDFLSDDGNGDEWLGRISIPVLKRT